MMAVRRLECDREETAAAQGVQRRIDERFRKELEEMLTDRESGPRQESEILMDKSKKHSVKSEDRVQG